MCLKKIYRNLSLCSAKNHILIPASFGLKIEVNFLRHFTTLLLKLFWIWIFRQLKFAIECFYNYFNKFVIEMDE